VSALDAVDEFARCDENERTLLLALDRIPSNKRLQFFVSVLIWLLFKVDPAVLREAVDKVLAEIGDARPLPR
jgi:hypothetical protein